MSGGEGTPGHVDGPAGKGDRPADAARRALRAARERERYGAEAGEPRGSAAARAAARPGDVAREALRKAAESRAAGAEGQAAERGAAAPTTGRDPGARPGEEAEPGARSGEDTKPGARPGDIAREALRAARDAADRARVEAEGTDAEDPGGKGGRGSRPARPGEGRGTRGGARRALGDRDEGNRARALRELLADAFQSPSEGPEPHETPTEGTDHGRARDGVTATGEGVPHAAVHDSSVHDHTAHDDPGLSLAPGGTSARREPSPAEAEPGAVSGPESAPGVDRRDSLTALPPGADHPRADRPGGPRPDSPATPRVPRTMAAPSRDGELRRTFRPFPPRPSAGEAFAGSWWGNAWVTALEKEALDPARLARGRAYADKGHVDAITVTPGLVLAYVHGSRPRPYRVQVRLRTLDDGEWDRFLDAAAEQPGHIAALLDKELPQALAGPEGGPGPAAPRGVRLLPGPGELEPRCGCPDFGHPCKHAAALCYQTARLLDEDPFVLLLLRGRGERELIDALSRRNAARAARAAQEREPAPLPGVRARDALAPRTLPPLPAPLPPPPHPEQPPAYPGGPGDPDPFALDQLATDAAARAHALLTTGRDPVAELTLWQDAVRLAAARPGSGLTAATRALYSSLAAATGRTPADLARAVAAWRQGGLEGLTVLEEPWDPPAGRFDRARPLLLAADLPAFRPWRNHLTHPRGHVQLRLGRDGLWYAYESEPGRDDWWPRGTPDLDPVGTLSGLGTTED
ncbi:SWIM zinc finger family protein [Streptomyces sp. TG1A-60]|uniref:SWIM zinc finger family protein n=1 Tax=Streptomyces sp. TG1A-60 TaxID=3129111 RepID=UPI0030D1F052